MKRILIPLGLLLAFQALAQESATYRLSEHAFNAGGHPLNGAVPSSASYMITLDAAGDITVVRDLGSTSYRMDGGFVAGHPPPGEVRGLDFTDPYTLVWSSERSAGHYHLYRDLMSNLIGLGYGDCEQQDLPDNTTTDPALPPNDDGYFYLVTVVNRLDEEGTKGTNSGNTERSGAVCP